MRRWIILLVAALCLVGCEAGFVQLDIPRHPELLGNKNESSDKDNGSYVSHVRCYVTSAPYHTIIKWYEKELKIGSKTPWSKVRKGHYTTGNVTLDASMYNCKAINPKKGGRYLVVAEDREGAYVRLFEVRPKSKDGAKKKKKKK